MGTRRPALFKCILRLRGVVTQVAGPMGRGGPNGRRMRRGAVKRRPFPGAMHRALYAFVPGLCGSGEIPVQPALINVTDLFLVDRM